MTQCWWDKKYGAAVKQHLLDRKKLIEAASQTAGADKTMSPSSATSDEDPRFAAPHRAVLGRYGKHLSAEEAIFGQPSLEDIQNERIFEGRPFAKEAGLIYD